MSNSIGYYYGPMYVCEGQKNRWDENEWQEIEETLTYFKIEGVHYYIPNNINSKYGIDLEEYEEGFFPAPNNVEQRIGFFRDTQERSQILYTMYESVEVQMGVLKYEY